MTLPGWVPRIVRDALVVDDVTECWEWQGERSSKGYGLVTVRLRRWRVHRYVWRASGRALPDSMTLDHVCRNTACANPAHLEAVTRVENVAREWDARIAQAWAIERGEV